MAFAGWLSAAGMCGQCFAFWRHPTDARHACEDGRHEHFQDSLWLASSMASTTQSFLVFADQEFYPQIVTLPMASKLRSTNIGGHYSFWCNLAWHAWTRSRMGWYGECCLLRSCLWSWLASSQCSVQSPNNVALLGECASCVPMWMPSTSHVRSAIASRRSQRFWNLLSSDVTDEAFASWRSSSPVHCPADVRVPRASTHCALFVGTNCCTIAGALVAVSTDRTLAGALLVEHFSWSSRHDSELHECPAWTTTASMDFGQHVFTSKHLCHDGWASEWHQGVLSCGCTWTWACWIRSDWRWLLCHRQISRLPPTTLLPSSGRGSISAWSDFQETGALYPSWWYLTMHDEIHWTWGLTCLAGHEAALGLSQQQGFGLAFHALPIPCSASSSTPSSWSSACQLEIPAPELQWRHHCHFWARQPLDFAGWKISAWPMLGILWWASCGWSSGTSWLGHTSRSLDVDTFGTPTWKMPAGHVLHTAVDLYLWHHCLDELGALPERSWLSSLLGWGFASWIFPAASSWTSTFWGTHCRLGATTWSSWEVGQCIATTWSPCRSSPR